MTATQLLVTLGACATIALGVWLSRTNPQRRQRAPQEDAELMPHTGRDLPQSAIGEVKITGIEIPFGQLVVLFFKITLASVPVALVVSLIYFVLAVAFFRR